LYGGTQFANAQDEPKQIPSLDIILKTIRSDSEEKRSALFEKYAVAVDLLQKAFQDNLLSSQRSKGNYYDHIGFRCVLEINTDKKN